MPLLPTDQRSQVMIAVGVVALAAFGYYFQVPYTETEAVIAERQARAERLEAANARARAEAARGVDPKVLRKEAERSRATLAKLRQLVPTEHEVPGLLEQVSTAARRANLELGGVAPDPVLVGTDFDTYRYKVSVAGGYHALAAFLGNVGSLPRIVAPVTFQLAPRMGPTSAPAAARGRANPNTVLLASVVVQTYVAHAAPARRVAEGAAAATLAQGGEVAP